LLVATQLQTVTEFTKKNLFYIMANTSARISSKPIVYL